jgi:steroid delta-isomerase-like uncharacterized protein
LAKTNKAICARFAEALSDHRPDLLDEIVHPHFRRHCQATPDVQVESLDDFKRFLAADFEAMPDSRIDLHALIAEDDRVAFWATYEGTQTGQMGPFPPSGRLLHVDFAGYFRIESGKIAELWVTWDNLSMLIQLGHLKPPSNL